MSRKSKRLRAYRFAYCSEQVRVLPGVDIVICAHCGHVDRPREVTR